MATLTLSDIQASSASGDVRMFRISVDVRSFKAGLRLPMKAINACVRVVLPPEIVKLAMATPNSANAAKLTAPIRTHPPAMVNKGSEVALSNGYVSLELPASVSGLASALSKDIRLQAQIYHRDKYAPDSLIGVASIPMSSLMKEPWVDGYAPVYSPFNKADYDSQVNIGTLRVVLSAEELGPVSGLSQKPTPDSGKDHGKLLALSGLEDPFNLLKKTFNDNLGSKMVAVQTEAEDEPELKPRKKTSKKKSEKESKASKTVKSEAENLVHDPGMNVDKTIAAIEMDEKLRRYELEWEFERWKRAEEAKWRAGLQDKEMKKMAALEADWKQKEKDRIADIDKTRADLSNLESKFRAKIFALEKRERALVIAEEEASMRREALTRDCAQRASDAEVAVKRLQSECEHRVELERTKYSSLKEQYILLEKRLATSNASLAELEKQFCAYKSEHWKTSEAELVGQVMLLKQQCYDLRKKFEQAVRTKNDYKAQIQKMAKELAKLHKQHAQDEANRRAQDRGQIALQSLIETQARKNDEERMELKQLKEQLQNLQIQENAISVDTKNVSSVPHQEMDSNTSTRHKDSTGENLSSTMHGQSITNGTVKVGKSIISDCLNGLADGSQIDMNANSILKKRFNTLRQESDVFNDWLSSELAAEENMPRPKLPEHLLDMKEDLDGVTSLIGDETLPSEFDDDVKAFDTSVYGLQLSEFQTLEIKRLKKQRQDLLLTGVYTEEDRIIKGLDQEIQRLQSVDTSKFGF